MSVARNLLFGTLLGTELAKDLISPPARPDPDIGGTPTFGLVGGELFNKGAQAMTFTTVDILRRNYPNADIILFSSREFLQDREVQYQFRTLPWDEDVKLHLFGYGGDALRRQSWDSETIGEIRSVLKDATAIFDISGYSLSNQLGIKTTVSYMTGILLSSKYDTPYYILPQSIGPLSYDFPKRYLTETMFRTYLPYVSLICPREEAGVDAVNRYTADNVQLERDLVLQRPDYNLSNIATDIKTEIPDIESDAVGVIPNRNVLEYSDQDMVELYKKAIRELKSDYSVYILRHSADDDKLCKQLYASFEDDPQVYDLNSDFNAVQLEEIISSFLFVVASRYHSIIHAYRSDVPAIVVGWAEKYRELVGVFDQTEYFFDCRQRIRQGDITTGIRKLSNQLPAENEKIRTESQSIRGDRTVLDEICTHFE